MGAKPQAKSSLNKNVHPTWFGKCKSFELNVEIIILYLKIYILYSERQKYGINSLKIKQNFFQKNLWIGQF
jgi:hypothetical protein